jgi:hypothetical protein
MPERDMFSPGHPFAVAQVSMREGDGSQAGGARLAIGSRIDRLLSEIIEKAGAVPFELIGGL